jgi:hypothetical protein
MICSTVKEGHECMFMRKTGCHFNGGSCHPIVEACVGCQRAKEFATGSYCLVFPEPAAKWRVGTCNMATHINAGEVPVAAKMNPLKASKKLNPLKASKRKAA